MAESKPVLAVEDEDKTAAGVELVRAYGSLVNRHEGPAWESGSLMFEYPRKQGTFAALNKHLEEVTRTSDENLPPLSIIEFLIEARKLGIHMVYVTDEGQVIDPSPDKTEEEKEARQKEWDEVVETIDAALEGLEESS